MTAELHTGVAATPGGYKAWVVGLSPYTPSVGHWDWQDTFSSRAKADQWVGNCTREIKQLAAQRAVPIKVRHWLDGVEQPANAGEGSKW